MRRMLLALLPAAALVVACSSPSGGSPVSSTAAPSGPAASSSSVPPSAATTRIEVSLTDALKIEPGSFHVPAGVPVTFVVTNRGATDHEFYLGDETAQAAHETEMAGMGGMAHDEPNGIGLKPGVTKELIFTFPAAGSFLAGCHVVGHYAAGMKAQITVGG